VITEEFETSLTIIRRILDRLGVHPTRIDRAILDIREKHYEPFQSRTFDGVTTGEAIRMFEGEVRDCADGQSIGDLGLRRASGATIVAVDRDGTVTTNPGPEFILKKGDHLHLIGSEQEVGRALTLI